jgi:hypothetical protein
MTHKYRKKVRIVMLQRIRNALISALRIRILAFWVKTPQKCIDNSDLRDETIGTSKFPTLNFYLPQTYK